MTGLAEKAVSVSEGVRARARLDVAGVLAVLTATACWGTSGVLIRFIVDSSGVTALALAFWRDVFTFPSAGGWQGDGERGPCPGRALHGDGAPV